MLSVQAHKLMHHLMDYSLSGAVESVNANEQVDVDGKSKQKALSSKEPVVITTLKWMVENKQTEDLFNHLRQDTRMSSGCT